MLLVDKISLKFVPKGPIMKVLALVQIVSQYLNKWWPTFLTHICVTQPRWSLHDDVIKWKHFPRYWPFLPGIHRWHGALMFSVICAWINGWVNNRETCVLRRHRAHYDVSGKELKCSYFVQAYVCQRKARILRSLDVSASVRSRIKHIAKISNT